MKKSIVLVMIGLFILISYPILAKTSGEIHKKYFSTGKSFVALIDCKKTKEANLVSCVLQLKDKKGLVIYKDSFKINPKKIAAQWLKTNAESETNFTYSSPNSKKGYIYYDPNSKFKTEVDCLPDECVRKETKAVQSTEQWWADTRKRWPIIDQLVTGNEGDHFDIDSINPEGNTDVNKIYFVIILDYPMSDSGNCGAMKRYKNDALDWIRSKGFDPNSMKITYENDFYHCLDK